MFGSEENYIFTLRIGIYVYSCCLFYNQFMPLVNVSDIKCIIKYNQVND